MPPLYDTIIIGGSYAGLSAALALGRSLRCVLVIDGGEPCNRFAAHSQNFITQDGRPPHQIVADAKAQIKRYDTVYFTTDTAVEMRGKNDAFVITTASGTDYKGRKLLFATGLHDTLPDLPGVRACWGNTIIHCPYCHGYEVKQRPTAIFSNNEHAPFMVRLIGNWTDELTLLTDGPATFDTAAIIAAGISVDERPLEAVAHDQGRLKQVQFKTGKPLSVAAMYLQPAVAQKCLLPEAHGAATDEQGFLVVNNAYETTLEGIYAAGDCTSSFRSVANAVAQGNLAGAMINHALLPSLES